MNINLLRIPTGRRPTSLQSLAEELNPGVPRINPAHGRMEDLNQGAPDFKSSPLNHSATLPPLTDINGKIVEPKETIV